MSPLAADLLSDALSLVALVVSVAALLSGVIGWRVLRRRPVVEDQAPTVEAFRAELAELHAEAVDQLTQLRGIRQAIEDVHREELRGLHGDDTDPRGIRRVDR